MKQLKRTILVYLASLIWLSFLIPWDGFVDPDAFYHAKISDLIWRAGPLQSFPWLDLTQLGKNFADLHFGFHLIVAPFTHAFGMFQGLRIASVMLAAAFFVVFYVCLERLLSQDSQEKAGVDSISPPYEGGARGGRLPETSPNPSPHRLRGRLFVRRGRSILPLYEWGVRGGLVWLFLLLLTQPFLVRLLLGKASPLAILWFVLGLTLAWKRKPWLVGIVGFCFALSHGGWVFLLGSIILLGAGNFLYDRLVQDYPWKKCFSRYFWLETAAALVGALLGWVIHPNFPNTFILGFTQVISIGLGTPHNLRIGSEWLPATLPTLLSSFAPWVMAVILGLGGLLLAPKKPVIEPRARLLVSLSLVLAAFFALTLKSRRNVEYLAPVLALWCATLWSLVDVREYWQVIKRSLLGLAAENTKRSLAFRHMLGTTEGRRPEPFDYAQDKLRAAESKDLLIGRWFMNIRFWFMTCVILFALLFGRQVYEVWTTFHPVRFPDNAYAGAMSAISNKANPGDRVFHSSWDEFPLLFALDDRLRYVSGLDPTFLHVASSSLSDRVREVTYPATSTSAEQAWQLIRQDLKSRFIFISKKNHDKFLELIRSDARYVPLADQEDSAAFMVQE